jgi:hypothetical protein
MHQYFRHSLVGSDSLPTVAQVVTAIFLFLLLFDYSHAL